MKRWLKAALFGAALVLMGLWTPLTAAADTGPKPSVSVSFTGAAGKSYYVTLLSPNTSTGPYTAYDGTNKNEWVTDTPEKEAVWQRLVDYRDADGYYFLQYFDRCEGDDTFLWGYYPPTPFKILLYFPQADAFVVSDVYERYAFDSYFTVDLREYLPEDTTIVHGEVTATTTTTAAGDTTTMTDVGTTAAITADSTADSPAVTLVAEPFPVVRSYDYTGEALSLVARMVLTMALELLLALAFGYRRRGQLWLIAGVNALTQLLLNGMLSLLWYGYGRQTWLFGGLYMLLEGLVFAVEAAVYVRFLKRLGDGGRHPVRYALAANALSFAAGWMLAFWIPSWF